MSIADDILNISQGNKLAWIGSGEPIKRQKDDFYPTPPDAIIGILTLDEILDIKSMS